MDVIGIGNLCVDYIMEIDRLPATDEFADTLSHSCQGGGRVANALSVLGRLGSAAQMFGITGDDLYGQFCKRDLEEQGVDVSKIITQAGANSNFCVVLAEKSTGGRSIVRQFGTCRKLQAEELPEDSIYGARFLHLADMGPVSVRAAELMRKSGGTVVMDADEFDPEIEAHMNLIDIFICAKQYYNSLFPSCDYEEGLRRIIARGPHTAIVTLGSKGCAGVSREGYFRLPCFPVEVVDSTGAGDVFHGAYIYGELQGWCAKEGARFASAVSAIKCTVLGGRAGIPNLKMVQDFIQSGTFDDTELRRRSEMYRRAPAR